MPLSQTLIESALKLTGKVMSEMEEDETYDYVTVGIFSYPKFFYYLFSENFIEKYALIAYEWSDDTYKYRASQSI